MTYTYYYQTKENENRSATIKARDRADAYTQLRKQGIRPYRVVGDDPIRWRPWALGGAILVLVLGVVGLSWAVYSGNVSRHTLQERRQLEGDAHFLMEKAVDGWDGVFDTKLDRYLAAYAQPGDAMIPMEATPDDYPTFLEELKRPIARSAADRTEIRQLKDILVKLREEMKAYLANGGSVNDYLDFLEERQEGERALRRKILHDIRQAPEEKRHRLWLEANLRLKELKLVPIPEPRHP